MLKKICEDPNIFQIDVPLPDNPLRNLNCYIIQDKGETLILDTGFNRPECEAALLAGLCARLLYSSFHARDSLGSYICVGAFAMVAFQSIFNIGMCLSVLPVIGITLPFLSSGGTSVVALYAAMGLVVSVKMHSSSKMFS